MNDPADRDRGYPRMSSDPQSVRGRVEALERVMERLVAGIGQTVQHRESLADGVRARRQALVRQGLPGRELRHRVRVVGRPQAASAYETSPQYSPRNTLSLVRPNSSGHGETAAEGKGAIAG